MYKKFQIIMEKKSVNCEDLQIASERFKAFNKGLGKAEKEIVATGKVTRKQPSHDFVNAGLKNFLPKNMFFSPLARPSEQKFASKTFEKRRFSKEAELKVKENIERFNEKKISVRTI